MDQSNFSINPHYVFLSIILLTCSVCLYFLSILANSNNIQLLLNDSFQNYVRMLQISICVVLFIVIGYSIFYWKIIEKNSIRSTILTYCSVCALVLVIILLYCNTASNKIKMQIKKLFPDSLVEKNWNELTRQEQKLLQISSQQLLELTANTFNTSWFMLTGIMIYTIFQFAVEYIYEMSILHTSEKLQSEQRYSSFVQQESEKRIEWRQQLITEAEKKLQEAEQEINIQQSEQLKKLKEELQKQRNEQTIAFQQKFQKQIEELTSQFQHLFPQTDDVTVLSNELQSFLKPLHGGENNDNVLSIITDVKQLNELFGDVDTILEEAGSLENIQKNREKQLQLQLTNAKISNIVTAINTGIVYSGIVSSTPFLAAFIACQVFGVQKRIASKIVDYAKILPTFQWPGWLPKFSRN